MPITILSPHTSYEIIRASTVVISKWLRIDKLIVTSICLTFDFANNLKKSSKKVMIVYVLLQYFGPACAMLQTLVK